MWHPETRASPSTEGESNTGYGSIGDQARLMKDDVVPPIRCVDSVIAARLVNCPPTSHFFFMCRIYGSMAHGRSGRR